MDVIEQEIARISRAEAVDSHKEYYAFRFSGTLDGKIEISVFNHWVGYENNDVNREIREASGADPDWWIKAWTKLGEKFLVINSAAEVLLLFREGGNALVEKSLARNVFAEHVKPSVHEKRKPEDILDAIRKPPSVSNKAPTPKIRMKVIERDKYRCRICGRRATDNVDLELNVHHIIPSSEGGLSEQKNLITLCGTCHRGLHPHFNPELFDLLPDEQKLTHEELRFNYRVAEKLYKRAWLNPDR
jgi:hypothetical protein